jgi:hypothetical protein
MRVDGHALVLQSPKKVTKQGRGVRCVARRLALLMLNEPVVEQLI